MKAVCHTRYGPPDVVLEFREVDDPRPSDDELLVRVHSAGVGIGDWLVTQGLPYIARPSFGLRRPKEQVAGHEMAGVVEEAGPGVTGFRRGDEVFGYTRGAFAEYVTVSQDALAAKPENVSFEQASATPVSGLAALQALRDKGGVGEGSRVLVIGASGAVGTFAVQIAKALGAEVTGVCSTRNIELVRSLGADDVIDYTKEALTAGGRSFDVVVDLAGNRSIRELRSALTKTGTLVIVGGNGGRLTMGSGRTLRALLASPFVSQNLRAVISEPNRDDLESLASMLASGDITPAIDKTFSLSATSDAIDYVGARHSQGKTVVAV